MKFKNLLIVGLLSSATAFIGVAPSFQQTVNVPIVQPLINTGNYQDDVSLFYSVGAMYNEDDKGIIVNSALDTLSFVVGNVDDNFDVMSKPYFSFVYRNFNDLYFFSSPLVFTNDNHMTTPEWFNVRQLNIVFDYYYNFDILNVSFRGFRVINNVLTSFSFGLDFDFYEVVNDGWQPGVMLINDVSFNFYNSSSLYDFEKAYDEGKQAGLIEGKGEGEAKGFDEGYRKGIDDASLQSNLLGSTIYMTIGSVGAFLLTISQFEIMGISIGSLVGFIVGVGLIILILGLVKKW